VTPTDQTRFYDKEAGLRGNCLQAALASLLDFPLAAVPNFAEHEEHEWHDNLYKWLRWLGLDMETYAERVPPKGYSIANGPSPRGIRHSTVALDGEIVFDPHPSRGGLLAIDGYWAVIAIGGPEPEIVTQSILPATG
jgi:hypothetical protein